MTPEEKRAGDLHRATEDVIGLLTNGTLKDMGEMALCLGSALGALAAASTADAEVFLCTTIAVARGVIDGSLLNPEQEVTSDGCC